MLDANVYLDAVLCEDNGVLGDPPNLGHIPSLPPRSVHPALHVLGVIRDGRWSLATSDHIDAMVDWRLEELGWPPETRHGYLDAVADLAELSGGGYFENVPRTQFDCTDDEDNRILDLAHEVNAMLIVSNDSDLLSLARRTGWRGRPIISPLEFATRAEVAARRSG